MTIEIGRLCIKTAGRDAGKRAVIVDILDERSVLIDGETRRKRCNIAHLELLGQVVKLEKNQSHEEVLGILKGVGVSARNTKPKSKTEKPKKKRKTPEQIRAQKEGKRKIKIPDENALKTVKE